LEPNANEPGFGPGPGMTGAYARAKAGCQHLKPTKTRRLSGAEAHI
jgi:hypothetical protein